MLGHSGIFSAAKLGSGIYTLAKKAGVPTLNTVHSMASGLVFYGYDTGVQQPLNTIEAAWGGVGNPHATTSYVELVTGNPMWGAFSTGVGGQLPFTLSAGTTPYGTATQFTGTAMDLNNTASFWPVDPDANGNSSTIHDASFLAWSPAGTGNTFACTAYLTGLNTEAGSQIFGRPAHASAETTPLHNWDFILEADGTLSAYVLDGAGGVNLTNPKIGGTGPAYTLNTLVSLVCTTQNDTSGTYFGSEASATSKFYVNGSLVGSTSGIAMYTTTHDSNAPYWFGFSGSGSGLQDNEGQIQFGSAWHWGAPGNNFFGVNGFVYQGMFWNRALTSTEVALLNTQPYCMLNY
jgi:hypothetical protein